MTSGQMIDGPFLVDAHVHFHSCFDREDFFENALGNVRTAAAGLGFDPGAVGCLLFTESAGERYFQRFRALAGQAPSACGWQFRPTGEAESLIAGCGGRDRLILIAGRQIVTAEGLEVLAIGCDTAIPDGGALPDVVASVRAAGGLPVLPWGFGKWWLGRGRVLAGFLDRPEEPGRGAPPVFLGDNGGRLERSLRPAWFGRAEARGIAVLPGSDPLPFVDQVRKVAGYGFVLDGALDRDRPAAGLKALIAGLAASPRPYGRLESLPGFVRSQIKMQIVKRLRRPAEPREAAV